MNDQKKRNLPALQSLPLSFYRRHSTGDLMSRISRMWAGACRTLGQPSYSCSSKAVRAHRAVYADGEREVDALHAAAAAGAEREHFLSTNIIQRNPLKSNAHCRA
jgi:hypothetical protein